MRLLNIILLLISVNCYGALTAEEFNRINQMANDGDADAQLILANCYGTSKNDTEGMKWLISSAQLGNREAQFSLGSAYKSGWYGLPVNKAEAVKWWLKAAEQGDNQATLSLGFYYLYQDKNPPRAIMWLRNASERGDGGSSLLIANCYFLGEGVPPDKIESYAYALLAKSQGLISPLDNISTFEENLSPNEIREAQRRATYLYKQTEFKIKEVARKDEEEKKSWDNRYNKIADKPQVVAKLGSAISDTPSYFTELDYLYCFLLIVALYLVTKNNFELPKTIIGIKKANLNQTEVSSKRIQKSYFSCWWKTAVILLIAQGILGYWNAGENGMALMLGRGLVLSPLHALWIGWIWWSIKK